jgi:MFS family permease
MNPLKEATQLSRASFITEYGSWISFFGLMAALAEGTGSAAYAGAAYAATAMSAMSGAFIGPYLMGYFSSRSLLILSQVIPALSTLIIAVHLRFFPTHHLWIPTLLFVIIGICEQIFDLVRTVHLKHIPTEIASPRSTNADLLHSVFGARFFGPLTALALITALPIWSLFILDSISFFIASVLVFGVQSFSMEGKPATLRAIKHVFESYSQRMIFIVRSVIIWIPMGISNTCIIVIVSELFGRSVSQSAVFYSVAGAAGVLVSHFLRSGNSVIHRWFIQFPDYALAAFGFAWMGFLRFGFFFPLSFSMGLLVLGVAGIGNSAHMIASQSLRQKCFTKSQLPEVRGLEVVIASMIEASIAFGTTFLLARRIISAQNGLLIAACLFIALSSFYLVKPIRDIK